MWLRDVCVKCDLHLVDIFLWPLTHLSFLLVTSISEWVTTSDCVYINLCLSLSSVCRSEWHRQVHFFKVTLQVTSDPDDWTLLSSAVMIDCYSSAVSLCLSLTVPSSRGDEEGDERMTAAVKNSCLCCVWVRVWKQYINTSLYWGASANLHVFFVCVNETGIDMHTIQWWWENNGGLKGVSFIMVDCWARATILWT